MNSIPIFFSPSMVATPSKTDSPSAGKPALVVEDWMNRFEGMVRIERFVPATRRELHLAHDPSFVDGVLSCKIANGFGTRDRSVAESLPWTTGSMLAAARWLLSDDAKGLAAVSPTSGFHHAEYAEAMGFCTFNGLMVTALALLEHNPELRIGIIDCDFHYGNGTDNIINHLGVKRVSHWTAGYEFTRPTDVPDFFRHLQAITTNYARDCDVILYQAGADQHVNDPYGGFLTNDELRRRDRTVFEICRSAGAPVVWNLAGGYQRDARGTIEPVLAIHRATMEECIAVFGRRAPHC